MNRSIDRHCRATRRAFVGSWCAAAAPWIVPAHVLGAGGATPPSGKIAMGVLGVGSQGQWDMRAFLNHDDVRVAALCDVNRRNVESAKRLVAERYGKPDIRVYSDFHALNADASIDAVLMALPVHWHSIPSADAALRGKHIYHEKPMGMSLVEAQCVRAAVHKTRVVFQFGTQQRSDLYFRWACELAQNGRLGRLREIQVSVPAGRQSPQLPEQPTPDYVDWDRWVGPAPATPFHQYKLQRDWHENIASFSLGMISCWGIHHLDIAQWGNGTDATGPTSVEGTGTFPKQGACNAILDWKVRFEFDSAAPVAFVSDSQGFEHGVRFVGETGWVHAARGSIRADNDALLRDPRNKCGEMPKKLPVSRDHTRNFVDAVKSGTRALSDIDAAVRGDTLCQLALIAVLERRKLRWDPRKEEFPSDAAANQRLQPRPMRGPWKLPQVA
jgi:predicted dehydrogenase